MTLRVRLLVWVVALIAATVTVVAWGIQREVERRLVVDFADRVADVAAEVEAEFARQADDARDRLRGIARAIVADNQFRRGLSVQGEPRRYVIEYGERTMQIAGLDVLTLSAGDGRILSSGHFRNAFDQPTLVPAAMARAGLDFTLLQARTPTDSVLALVVHDTVRLGAERVDLVGGIAVDEAFLARLTGGGEVRIALRLGTTPPDTGPVVRELRRTIALPMLDAGGRPRDDATLVITHARTGLERLQRGLRQWVLTATAVTIAIAMVLVWWVSARLSRPLATLARKTEVLDLDRLDVEFAMDRTDEVGRLARLLDGLVRRLRRGAARLRDAERRATVADLARQVNHDIKNGLTPIRNVFRHLEEVADREPDRLAGVFQERRGTISSSIQYLHDLAANYARLSPRLDRGSCALGAVVHDVAAEYPDGVVACDLPPDVPHVAVDPVVVRRVLENIIGNGVESAGTTRSAVSVTARSEERGVQVRVCDNGPGMNEEELARAFDDFYTTKAHGTGLGLSVVRRLVADAGGALQIHTEPGRGTTVVITFPVVGTGPETGSEEP